jgi:hypothetical protein
MVVLRNSSRPPTDGVLAQCLARAVILQCPQVAAGENLVIADDALASRVVALGIVPVHPDVIGRDRAVIVGVGLGVGQGIPLR